MEPRDYSAECNAHTGTKVANNSYTCGGPNTYSDLGSDNPCNHGGNDVDGGASTNASHVYG